MAVIKGLGGLDVPTTVMVYAGSPNKLTIHIMYVDELLNVLVTVTLSVGILVGIAEGVEASKINEKRDM